MPYCNLSAYQDGVTAVTVDFCTFENKFNETMSMWVRNVSDPVGEFWQREVLQQSEGVSLFFEKKAFSVHFFHKFKKNFNTFSSFLWPWGLLL